MSKCGWGGFMKCVSVEGVVSGIIRDPITRRVKLFNAVIIPGFGSDSRPLSHLSASLIIRGVSAGVIFFNPPAVAFLGRLNHARHFNTRPSLSADVRWINRAPECGIYLEATGGWQRWRVVVYCGRFVALFMTHPRPKQYPVTLQTHRLHPPHTRTRKHPLHVRFTVTATATTSWRDRGWSKWSNYCSHCVYVDANA